MKLCTQLASLLVPASLQHLPATTLGGLVAAKRKHRPSSTIGLWEQALRRLLLLLRLTEATAKGRRRTGLLLLWLPKLHPSCWSLRCPEGWCPLAECRCCRRLTKCRAAGCRRCRLAKA